MAAKKSQERDERARALAQRQKEQRGKERRVMIITWGTIGVVIASVAVAAVVVLSQAAEDSERVREAASAPIDGVAEPELGEPTHLQNLPEPEPENGTLLPPAGGEHDPAWLNCGVYTEPVVTTHAVHSLEHGAVWIAYQPSLDEAQVQTLTSKVANRAYTLLSPFPDLASPVVLTAWGHQLELESADDERIEVFLAKYVQGEQTPEPGAACSGGVSFTR